jgi:hypothetical protein
MDGRALLFCGRWGVCVSALFSIGTLSRAESQDSIFIANNFRVSEESRIRSYAPLLTGHTALYIMSRILNASV